MKEGRIRSSDDPSSSIKRGEIPVCGSQHIFSWFFYSDIPMAKPVFIQGICNFDTFSYLSYHGDA
jgi:hypothetical protein